MGLNGDQREMLAQANRQANRLRETLERHLRELTDLTPNADADLKEAADALRASSAVEAALADAAQEEEHDG